MELSLSNEGGASRGYLGALVLVWISVVTWLILINYYVTGLMVIHQLVINNIRIRLFISIRDMCCDVLFILLYIRVT